MAKPSLESFDHGDFAEYLERVKFYFIANDIGSTPASASAAEKSRADTKKAAYLVSFLSKSAYSTLKTLCLPDSPSDKKYEELCNYSSRTSKLSSRVRQQLLTSAKLRKA